MHTTSITLIQRLRAPDDHAAWERFVDLYSPLLFRWARRCGQDANDAADLVQDVFAALLKKLPEFHYDPRLRFRGWLRTVTMNLWRDAWRTRAARTGPVAADPFSEPSCPDPLDGMADEEYRSYLVARALELMRTDFQPATWKAAWEHGVAGRPAGDVARELDMTVGAVYAARFRVMNRLREELDGLLD